SVFFSTSHSRQEVSSEADARYFPEGWNSTRQTRWEWPESVERGVSCVSDQRWIWPSAPPDARLTVSSEMLRSGRVAPGIQAMPLILFVCPLSVRLCSRVGISMSLTWPPQLPVATSFPLGDILVMLTWRSPAV